MNRFPVDVEITLYGERKEHTVRVIASASPRQAQNPKGNPDDWTAAIGGDLEDVELYLVHGSKQRRFNTAMEEQHGSDLEARVWDILDS